MPAQFEGSSGAKVSYVDHYRHFGADLSDDRAGDELPLFDGQLDPLTGAPAT